MPNPNAGPVWSDIPVRTIDRDELRQKLARSDRFKLVMNLNEWAFLAKRIPGSIHFNTPDEMLAALQKDDEIVVYCSNPECLASLAAYHRLSITVIPTCDVTPEGWSIGRTPGYRSKGSGLDAVDEASCFSARRLEADGRRYLRRARSHRP